MKKILVVDDSPTITRTLSFMLRRMGYTTIISHNGLEALQQLDMHEVDIIITDINMPEMDGLTLMRTVRERANLQHIPIILLTDSGEMQQDDRRNSADEFLTKPISSHQLMGKISSLVAA